MSGILEQILDELKKLNAAVAAGPVVNTGGPTVVASTNGSTPTTSTSAVTNDMLVALVQPLVQDEGTKAKVKDVLTKYNLNRLGEAQESQYADLYREFEAIKNAPAPSSGDLI
jgi:hypothetical protein